MTFNLWGGGGGGGILSPIESQKLTFNSPRFLDNSVGGGCFVGTCFALLCLTLAQALQLSLGFRVQGLGFRF